MIIKPKRLEQRPHWRGLPIPYIALVRPDGEPDFRVTDEAKRASVIGNAWCQLCGQALGKFMFFTGGTNAAQANQYFEPAAHLDCLIYAMQVCPFIAGKKEHVDLAKVQEEYASPVDRFVTKDGKTVAIDIKADESYTTVKNPFWVIKKCKAYSLARTPGGTWLIVPQRIICETEPLHAESMKPSDWTRVMKQLMVDNPPSKSKEVHHESLP